MSNSSASSNSPNSPNNPNNPNNQFAEGFNPTPANNPNNPNNPDNPSNPSNPLVHSSSPSNPSNPSVVKFEFNLEMFLPKADQGECFIKHGRIGKPHPRIVTCNQYTGLLCWGSGYMYLQETSHILRGKMGSKILEKVGDKLDSGVCMSILSEGRSLDLQATSQVMRDEWWEGLIALKKLIQERKHQCTSGGSAQTHLCRLPNTLAITQTLIQGFELIKHGRRGEPHPVILRVFSDPSLNPNEWCVIWGEHGGIGENFNKSYDYSNYSSLTFGESTHQSDSNMNNHNNNNTKVNSSNRESSRNNQSNHHHHHHGRMYFRNMIQYELLTGMCIYVYIKKKYIYIYIYPVLLKDYQGSQGY